MIKKLQEANMQPLVEQIRSIKEEIDLNLPALIDSIYLLKTQDMAMVSQTMKKIDQLMTEMFLELDYLDVNG